MDLSPIDKHIGERLRLRRIALGCGLEELGRKTGIGYQQIGRYETGRNRMSAASLHGLAKALAVPVGYFFEGLDIPEPETKDLPSSREIQHLIETYLHLRETQRSKLRLLLKMLSEESS